MTSFKVLSEQPKTHPKFTSPRFSLRLSSLGRSEISHTVCVVRTTTAIIPQTIKLCLLLEDILERENVIGAFAVKQKLVLPTQTSISKYSNFRFIDIVQINCDGGQVFVILQYNAIFNFDRK